MPFTLVRQDITKMQVDAIVNAANTALQMGGGVCGAIFRAAGAAQLQAACDKLAPIQTGEAVMTPGFHLPARHIIHTAGPIYRGGNHGEEEQLRFCYLNSLKLAVEHQCQSIAFPLISSGIYGYPKDEALQVATSAIRDFLAEHDMDIYLVIFDKESFQISEELLGKVESYIDEHYVSRLTDEHCRRKPSETGEETPHYCRIEKTGMPMDPVSVPSSELDEALSHLDEPFSRALLNLIDVKGKTDVEVCKRANIDRKLFSKIRTGKGYRPGKRTVIALAIALELSLEETEDLLRKAGYALTRSEKFDVIIEFFIKNGRYDIFEINEVLFKYDLPLLGG
jgi:O-acetyl-ADP-ribose deacetylase (regulator of RNase III)